MKIKKFAFINLIILLTLVLVGCDSSTESENQPIDIVGIWDLTEIGVETGLSSSNSVWTFEADGTYEWFLLIESFDLEGQGTYSLDGNTLTIDDGFAKNVFGTGSILTFSNNNNTFSLLDNDGDRWTYNRRVE